MLKVPEKYKLYLNWDKVTTHREWLELVGARFSGPATNDMMKLVESDFILLNLTDQCIKSLNTFLICKFSWNGVQYNLDHIKLNQAFLQTLDIRKYIEMLDSDYILIDTSDHEVFKHEFNTTYPAEVRDSSGEMVEFEI